MYPSTDTNTTSDFHENITSLVIILISNMYNNVYQILATINFSSGEIDGKFLSVWN